jgi:hypothetical protein
MYSFLIIIVCCEFICLYYGHVVERKLIILQVTTEIMGEYESIKSIIRYFPSFQDKIIFEFTLLFYPMKKLILIRSI